MKKNKLMVLIGITVITLTVISYAFLNSSNEYFYTMEQIKNSKFTDILGKAEGPFK